MGTGGDRKAVGVPGERWAKTYENPAEMEQCRPGKNVLNLQNFETLCELVDKQTLPPKDSWFHRDIYNSFGPAFDVRR